MSHNRHVVAFSKRLLKDGTLKELKDKHAKVDLEELE
jgi:hypothetical protein